VAHVQGDPAEPRAETVGCAEPIEAEHGVQGSLCRASSIRSGSASTRRQMLSALPRWRDNSMPHATRLPERAASTGSLSVHSASIVVLDNSASSLAEGYLRSESAHMARARCARGGATSPHA
jgi:hypothetical protein